MGLSEEVRDVISQSAWVIPIVVTWMSKETDLISVNNEIFRMGTDWIEARDLSLAGGPSLSSRDEKRLEMELIVEQPEVDDDHVLPKERAEEFLAFMQEQALSRGWKLVGSYRRFTEEEGLPIPYLDG